MACRRVAPQPGRREHTTTGRDDLAVAGSRTGLEDQRVGRQIIEPADRSPGAVTARIPCRSEHYPAGRAGPPSRRARLQVALDDSLEDVEQVRREQRKDDLGLR